MIDHYARQWLPAVVDPLLTFYRRRGFTPNQITTAGLVGAILASLAVAQGWFVLAIILWWAGRLLDGTDGIYARRYGLQSPFGAYWDFVADMAAYSSMILGFAAYHSALTGFWLLILLFYVLCSSSALALGAQEDTLNRPKHDNRGLRLGAGLAEGGETGIAYTLFCLFPQAIHWLAPLWLSVLAATVVVRTILARRVLQEEEG